MKIEKILENFRSEKLYGDDRADEAFVIEFALTKQIPKKPVVRNYATYSACECGMKIYQLFRFCPNCGQRIDWSVTE